jgi:hypothetical protein
MGQNRDVAWVIKHFRPLLEKIDIDNIPKEPDYQVEVLSDIKQFIVLGMEDCVLAICRKDFISKANGFYTFSHARHEGQQIFFLNIYINNNLFTSNSHSYREERRRAIIHEFTHCIAAFLSLGRIRTEKLVSRLVTNLASRVRINATEHYQIMLSQFSNASSTVTYALDIYPDEHFRLGYEDFEPSFSIVYKQLILDRNIFERFFTEDMRKEFSKNIKNGNTTTAQTILLSACVNLISNEAVSSDFVSLRLREEFLRYYYNQAA